MSGKNKTSRLSYTLALMEAASFAASSFGTRQQRYSVQQEIAPDYQSDYFGIRIVTLKICSNKA
jgi:hypothetical protein